MAIEQSIFMASALLYVTQVRSSVAVKDLDFYREWNDEFGSFAFESHEG